MQQERSASLTHDQCHNVPSKVREELDATKLSLFRAEEQCKVMSAKIARLEKDKKNLLERLEHSSVRVSACCAYLVHSDDLILHQATPYVQHGSW